MMFTWYHDPSNAFMGTLKILVNKPDYLVAPRGLPCRELVDYQFSVAKPRSGSLITMDVGRDLTMARYLKAEETLYDAHELRVSVWAEQASKFWAGIANADGTINSNYGWLMNGRKSAGGKTQWEWARQRLLDDPDTRQAFIRVSLPDHQQEGIKDQVCTMHMNFLIRDGALNGTVVMRSNDVIKGLAYDMPWFCLCLERMANDVNRPVGTYTHFAHSMHLYERDLPIALRMLGRKPDEKTARAAPGIPRKASVSRRHQSRG